MKKALSLILALVLCLSLCACGGSASQQSNKYDALINCIENNDYMGAMTELHKLLGMESYTGAVLLDPSYSLEVNTEPTASYSAVEITMENWQEYFEIVVVEDWKENAFGDPDYLSRQLVFRPNDAYADKVVSTFQEHEDYKKISVEIGYDYTNYKWTIDFENETYAKGSKSDYDPEGHETTIITYEPYLSSSTIDSNNRWTDGTGSTVISEYSNIEVLRIQGTLLLEDS